MSDIHTVEPLTEDTLAARQIVATAIGKAVAGADEEILKAGGSPEQASAVKTALRLFMFGDKDGAREVLSAVFRNGMVDRILSEFAAAAAEAEAEAEAKAKAKAKAKAA